MSTKSSRTMRQLAALLVVWSLLLGAAHAGIAITGADGIAITGADGIAITGADGIAITGADGIAITGADGIAITGADGIGITGADGIGMTGADGVPYAGANGIAITGADGIAITGADGIAITGADGIAITGADGTHYNADSLILRQPNGIAITGADGARITGADGVAQNNTDGLNAATGDGIAITGADGIAITGADGATVLTADGRTLAISPNGIAITGADSVAVTRANGIAVNGAQLITQTGLAGLVTNGANDVVARSGLQSVDPELALTLNRLTDDSTVNCVLVYHHLPTDADLADLQRIGFVGGTRFRMLPMVIASGTRDQIIAVSHLPAVRSIYGNRTLQFAADPGRGVTGVDRVASDAELSNKNSGLPFTGRGVTVAVLDTGVDGTHSDLVGRVAQNVKLADAQGIGVGFNYPLDVENVPTTDQAYGHGTFVAGVIAGNGTRSSGAYTGVAPNARLVGLSAGDVNLFYVLDGFDYLLQHAGQLNVRVVNCSFSAETVFDTNDPVNIATKMLTDRGVSVVVSAGNTGPGMHTLNPYAVAPWVISVGATDFRGRLASFSSRGEFASSLFRPTLVAPGVGIISLRATGVNQTSAEGVAVNNDAQNIPAQYLPYYTTASGTSFSAPQVAGAIALMLEANPSLSPAQVRDILARTATPMPSYYAHEVGAGMLNTHAAVLEAAFPQRRMGTFRATQNMGQVRFINDPLQQINGTTQPGTPFDARARVPQNALFAAMQVAWSSLSVNDLGLALYDESGTKRADVNLVNLPGLTGKRERAVVQLPAAGQWRVRVTNTLPVGTAQPFVGILETGHAEYASLRDINSLSAAARSDIYQALRTLVMQPIGANFRPYFAVTRADLAASLVAAGRAPQYVPGQPTYRDVRDPLTMLYVESAQHAPTGPLFLDASGRGNFAPTSAVDRMTAAVVLVRAAGWQAEVNSQSSSVLGILDAPAVPTQWRGYVSVALRHGLLTADNLNFRPQAGLTRAELAHALAVIENAAAQ